MIGFEAERFLTAVFASDFRSEISKVTFYEIM